MNTSAELASSVGPSGAPSMASMALAMGYNHEVRHRGRGYHVQTEDSGRTKGHIFTHVFHRGSIIASNRVPYETTAASGEVLGLLQSSHKTMLRSLLSGAFDGKIATMLGEPGDDTTVAEPEATEPPETEAEAEAIELPTVVSTAEVAANDTMLASEEPESPELERVRATLNDLSTRVLGCLGIAMVDYETGLCLGTAGHSIDTDAAAAANMEVVEAELRAMRALGIEDEIEDILVTLAGHYHIIHPVGATSYLYIVLDRERGNLALTQHRLATAAAELQA